MSLHWIHRNTLKTLLHSLVLLATPVFSTDIFEYHKDFHFLLERGKQLYQIPKKIDLITPELTLEVQVFAAADIRASAELLFTSTSMLMQQHAAMVEIFTETEYFKDSHIRPSIQILLDNAAKVHQKCTRYMTVIKRPDLFQQILDLDAIATDIQDKLVKYSSSVVPEPTDTLVIPSTQSRKTE